MRFAAATDRGRERPHDPNEGTKRPAYLAKVVVRLNLPVTRDLTALRRGDMCYECRTAMTETDYE